MRKFTLLLSFVLLVLNNLQAQNSELKAKLDAIKDLVESQQIQGFTYENSSYNPCRFEFEYDLNTKSISVTRIQIFEKGKSDMTMEREKRTIRLDNLDKENIQCKCNGVNMISLQIPVKNGKHVKIESLKQGEKSSSELDFLSIGPYKFKKRKKFLRKLKKLFYQAIELAE